MLHHRDRSLDVKRADGLYRTKVQVRAALALLIERKNVLIRLPDERCSRVGSGRACRTSRADR